MVADLATLAKSVRPVAVTLAGLLQSFQDTGGIERLMDYIFYQAAAINGFDSVGHYLRAELIVNQCATYAIEPLAGCSANFPASTASSSSVDATTSALKAAGDDPVLRATAIALARALGKEIDKVKTQVAADGKTPAKGKSKRSKTEEPLESVPTVGPGDAAPTPAPTTAAPVRHDRRPRRDRPALGPDGGSERGGDADPGRRPLRRAAGLPLRQGRRRMRGRGGGIAGNPVLIGAATVLVILVAVFLSYNANKGLPFVPTYQLEAEVPSGAQLVVGNDVKIGGSRVGAVTSIKPRTLDDGTVIAVLGLTLDKDAGPLPKDSTLMVRPRSALGLKYVEITRGKSSETYADGDTVALAQAGTPVELDEFLNMFDEKTRIASQIDLQGFGTALAGRGESINTAIGAFRPLLRDIIAGDAEPVGARDRPAAPDHRGQPGGRDRGARVRGPGLAVQEPRRHDARAARGRAPVHPGLDHRRQARAGRRHRGDAPAAPVHRQHDRA